MGTKANETARAAGTGIGAIFNNPTFLIIGALAVGLFIFRDKISGFFQSSIDNFELPPINIELPEITFPELPEIEFPDFSDLFDFFGGGGNDGNAPIITDNNVPQDLNCPCGTKIVQTADGTVTTTCIACGGGSGELPSEFGPDNIPAECIEIPQIGGGSFNSCSGVFTPAEIDPIIPPIDVDPDIGGDFGGGGPTFIGGSINPISFSCGMSLSQIIDAGLASSASEAANLKFEMCEQEDSDFDFGSNL